MKKNLLPLIIFIFLACFLWKPASSIAAEPGGGEETESSKLLEELKEGFEYTIRFLTSGAYQDVSNTSQNPNNDFFRIPRYLTELELRPDVHLNFRRLELSVKPRLNVEWRAWEDGTRKGDDEFDNDLFINEWLARMRVTEGLFVSYGRENLQWGPSYLFSPSNPFFMDNGRGNPKREVAGMDFARLVWLPGMSWTVSLIANLDEGRQEFRYYEFDKTYALKLDYAGQEEYAGLILSHKESDRTRLGAYGGWTATDALLLYGEGVVFRGSNALYPKNAGNPLGVSMEAADDDDSSFKSIFLVGGSYTLEMGPTLTVEYVYNGPGYSDTQADAYYRLRQDAADAYALTGLIQGLSRLTLSRTADPKLRFLRRNYVMLQYNHNDIKDVLNLTFRWTQNIDDGSGQFTSIVECFVGDHTQLFLVGSVNSGGRDTEFRTPLGCQCMIGLEYTF